MIPDSWLGHYGYGIDEEDGLHHLRLWRLDDQHIGFTYSYECRTNHGYDLVNQQGVVVAADDQTITVEIRSGSAASWEDWYKEDSRSEVSSAVQATIRIVRIENGHPVLGYGSGQLGFMRADRADS